MNNDDLDMTVTPYTLVPASKMADAPAMQWRVKGVLPRNGLAFVYGDSGSGKTFLVLDLAIAIASGTLWFELKTKPTKVVYVPLEGSGIPKRLKAWEVANAPLKLPTDLVLVKEREFSLNDPDNVNGMGQVILEWAGPGAVVIIDTLARASAGLDENSARDMGMAIGDAERLATIIDGLVILVHHTGKNPSSGMRGSSAMYAAAETVLEVSKDSADRVAWKATKLKDSGDYKSHSFLLEEVVCGQDEDDEPLTSCVVRPDVFGEALSILKGMGANQEKVYCAVRRDIEVNGQVFAHSKEKKAITEVRAKEMAIQELVESGVERPSDAVRDMWDSAKFKKVFCFIGGSVLRPLSDPEVRPRIVCLA